MLNALLDGELGAVMDKDVRGGEVKMIFSLGSLTKGAVSSIMTQLSIRERTLVSKEAFILLVDLMILTRKET